MKLFFEYCAELLLILLYMMYRISQSFTLYRRVDSYKEWRNKTQNQNQWTWFAFFWTVTFSWLFISFWWMIAIVSVITLISLLVSAWKGLRDILNGGKNEENDYEDLEQTFRKKKEKRSTKRSVSKNRIHDS